MAFLLILSLVLRCFPRTYTYIHKYIKKSELFTKQACRDERDVYSLFLSPTIYTDIHMSLFHTITR